MHLPTINSLVGHLVNLDIADPAAGSVFSVTVPARRVYRLRSLHFDFTAAAGGAARLVTLTITCNAQHFYQAEAPVTIPATQTGSFTCADFGFLSGTPALVVPIALPAFALRDM